MYTQIAHIIKRKKYQPKHLANSNPCKKHANIHSYHNLSAYRNICHIIADALMAFMIAASLVLSYETCYDIAQVHAVRAAEQHMAATNETDASVKYLGLSRYYDNILSYDEIESLESYSDDELRTIVPKISDFQKDVVSLVFANRIYNDE